MSVCHIVSYATPIPYEAARVLQETLAARRRAGDAPDTLLLLEHPPTITLGRAANAANLLTTTEALAARGIAVIPASRGGDVTYHAPGQLVGYPILDLREHGRDLHKYLRDLEETLIRALAAYDLRAERVPGLTGVWAGGRKIAAIGIKVANWISMHGFALNINPDLSPFREDIIPCGIADRGVTSLAELLPDACPTRADVEQEVVAAFCEVFQATPFFSWGKV